jgi:sirohydrochlorin cobaltochelatase
MDDIRQNTGLLIAAHGERGGDADNAGVARLTAALAARRVAGEIRYGLLKGSPTIETALNAFSAPELIVFPLFLSEGYFAHCVLARRLEEAARMRQRGSIHVLPPLGLDMALGDMIAAGAAAVADKHGLVSRQTTLVLLAHGSSRDSASRLAAERLARHIRERNSFSGVRTAFLEESPALGSVVEAIRGPVVIIGLFTGHGLHGAGDVNAMMNALRRKDTIFAGNLIAFPGLADVVAARIDRYWQSKRAGPQLIGASQAAGYSPSAN